MSIPRTGYGAYTIGWICALPKEMTAAIAMLEKIHDDLPQPASDYNNYSLGSIGDFNIVIASLPIGDMGSHQASAVATRMLATFPNLKVGLMVGIGGGVPSKEDDIRLGDVVVSIPARGFGGVVQHDMGKNTKDDGWVRTGSLNGPPSVLRTTISKLRSMHQIHGNKLQAHLLEMVERYPNLSPQFTRQEAFSDILYEPEPEDPGEFTGWNEIERPPREPRDSIKVHYGLIASGNQVIKSGKTRDAISRRFGGVLCFEMEAAGLMNELPCVVIRGICDYADAHKSKEWQEYAAAVAAAYAKELIMALPVAILEQHLLSDVDFTSPTMLNELASLQVQSQDTKPHWLVPFARNKHFVGRKQELSTLRQWSSSEDSCLNMAVFGLGGVGKTQVALEFVYCTRELNPSCSIFWVPATDHLAFEESYLKIGHMLNIPGIDANGADVKQLVKDALSNQKMGRWLMVIDNADDVHMVFRQQGHGDLIAPVLIDYLPSSPNGSILFTTRNRKVAVKHAASNTILLEMMGPEDANKLLRKSLLRKEMLADVNTTNHLLGLLGFLPLAITQAAAYINENDTTIDEYTSLYNDSETEVMEILSEHFEDQGRYKTTKNSIATTWLISLGQISRTSPVAIDYLSFMACLTNQNIPHSLLLAESSKKQSLEAVATLKAYSFIKKREDENSYDMHRLVHLATRNWLRTENKLHVWTDKAIMRLVDVLPAGGHKNRAEWTAYLPHAEYLLVSVSAAETPTHVVVLAEKLAKCLYSNGKYSEAYGMYERALELRTNASGPQDPDTLRNMFGMAEALSHQGKYRQAENQHRKILELRKKVLGPKSPEVGRSMNYLAQAIYYDGRFAEAEQVHREALELQKEALHPEHPNALTTVGYLAQTLSQQGKYKEAEEMHRNLLQIRLRVMGEDNPATLATLSCLGVAQGNIGNYADAEQTHRRVLDLRVQVLGDRHPHTLVTKRWLADALVHQARHKEARSLNQEVLELQIELLGLKHPNTILTLGNLGDILLSERRNTQAEEVYRQVLALQTEVLGPEHPETLGGMNSLANALHEQGRHEEAKGIYAKVFEARLRILGPEHPKTLATLR